MIRFSALFVFSLCLFLEPAFSQDAFEPNDGFDDATPITLENALNGTIHQNGDNDFYVFELEEAGDVTITVTGIPTVDWFAALHNSSRVRLQFWRQNAGADLTFRYTLPEGSYFLQLTDNGNNANSSESYSVLMELDRRDANEVNNTFDRATPLTLGVPIEGTILSFGDVDFYEFTTTTAGVLDVNLSGIANVDYFVALHNADRNRLEFWRPNTGADLSFTYLVEAGTYFIQVLDDGENHVSDEVYTLSIELDLDDVNEPNNSLDDATPLAFGETAIGTIRSLGDFDYYEFNVEQPGVLEIDLSGIASVDWFLAVYNEARDRLTFWRPNTGAPIFVTYLAAEPGTYFIEVVDDGNNHISDETYELRVELNTTDGNEPNNTFGDATRIGPDVVNLGTIWTFADVDVYSFQVTEPGLVDISIGNVPPNLNLDARLYNPQQARIDWQTSNLGQSLRYQVNVASDGLYYLEIYDRSSNAVNAQPYHLEVSGGIISGESPLLLGDVSANRVIDAGDASLALRWVVGLASLTGNQRVAADVDANGGIQAADASFILQRVVGLITEFPGESAGKGAGQDASIAWGTVIPGNEVAEVLIPVKVDQLDAAVTAAELELKYDPTLISVEEIRSNAPSGWNLVHNTIENGTTRIAMAGALPVSDEVLFFIRAHLEDARALSSLTATATVGSGTAHSLDPPNQLPNDFALSPNYPNPFNPRTVIQYAIPQETQVKLTVFAIDGRQVTTLVDGVQPAGTYEAPFEALGLASGLYIYRLEAGSFVETRGMLFLK